MKWVVSEDGALINLEKVIVIDMDFNSDNKQVSIYAKTDKERFTLKGFYSDLYNRYTTDFLYANKDYFIADYRERQEKAEKLLKKLANVLNVLNLENLENL